MDTSMLGQINALRRMTVSELRGEWQRLYNEPTRSRNRDYLWKRLSWRLQELAHGGLSDRAKTRIEELAPDGFVRAKTPQDAIRAALLKHEDRNAPRPTRTARDPRLPAPGTVITKSYKGRELRLVVLDDGFELDGVHHRSLSEAARAVTGSKWNGRLFFNLTTRKRKS